MPEVRPGRDASTMDNLTTRVARASARHPWRAIGIWTLFVVAASLAGATAGTRSATEEDTWLGESGRAAAIVRAAGLEPPATESVLVSARSGSPDAAAAFARELMPRLRSVAGVGEVGQPVVSADGATVLIPVSLAGDPATASDGIEPLLEATAAAQAQRPDLRVEQVGGASIRHGVNQQLGRDFQRAELVSVPVTLAILILAFGAIVAAGVPVLLALTSVAAAIGLSSLVSHIVPDAGTTTNMILLMGMAVGVDYSLFYLRREREERARGRGRLEAVDLAAATAGRAATVSGVAVIVSMAGLYIVDDVTFASLATGSILVVLVAVLGCLTVLPALLAKLGRAVNRPRLPLLWRWATRSGQPRLWPVLLRPALRRPALTLCLSTVGMLALAVPLVNLTLRSPEAADLPASIPAVQAYHRLADAFPGRTDSHLVAVVAPVERATAVAGALATLGDPRGIRASADDRVHVLAVAAPDDGPDAVRVLRERAAAALGDIPAVSYAVGGAPAEDLDYAEHQRATLPWVIGFVLALTFVVMYLAFRSVVLAVLSIVVNAMSSAAAFGLLVLVFQTRWAEGLLGFTATGAVVSWIPLFMFVVLFGLSMDYHVFVLSRIREAARRGAPVRSAVAEGMTASAPAVTGAAAVMVAVFAVFATLSMIEFKQLGVGLAAAVLLDAVVVRILILPAAIAAPPPSGVVAGRRCAGAGRG